MRLSDKLKSIISKSSVLPNYRTIIEDMLLEVEQWERYNLPKCPICQDFEDICYADHSIALFSRKELHKLNRRYTVRELQRHLKKAHCITDDLMDMIVESVSRC